MSGVILTALVVTLGIAARVGRKARPSRTHDKNINSAELEVARLDSSEARTSMNGSVCRFSSGAMISQGSIQTEKFGR